MSASTLEFPLVERRTALAAPAAPAAPELAPEFAGPEALDMVVEVAHDLRSPLASILFLAETLQSGQSGPLTGVQQRQLALIRSAALGLCASASDVMELAQGNRLAQRAPAPFALSEMFAAIHDMVRPLAEEKGLELRFLTVQPDCRTGHERALSRALLNLATNALKYTDRGYVEIAARVKSPTRVEFAVRDTGPGIPADALQTLYQAFPRGANARLRFSSAGLGLGIVRKLVSAMGAELRVMTRAGGGTRFWFEVDLPPASAS